MNNKYIGVFDSGMGGLTVVKCIAENMPDESIIFFGDTAHVPYGTRSAEQITEYVLNDVRFLNTFDVKAVVIACNTADSIAGEQVKELYTFPVFGVIEPAAKEAAAVTQNNKIGVIATNATVNSGAYEKNIARFNPSAQVTCVACPKLVPLIEDGHFQKGDSDIENTLAEYLMPLKKQGIDTVVLGCTHYALLYDIIADMLPEVNIVVSSFAVTKVLKNELIKADMQSSSKESERRYFVSGDAEHFESTAKDFMGGLCEKVVHAEI